MSERELRQQALTYLQAHQVMTLATNGADGVWAAAVFYVVTAAFDFFFLSARHTRHAQHLAVNPYAAATVQENYIDWAMIQGIQLEGGVTLLTGGARETAVALYRQRFSFLNEAPVSIQKAFQKVAWYQLQPTHLYFIDNGKGFGHRDKIQLP